LGIIQPVPAAEVASFELPRQPDAVRLARRFVEHQVAGSSAAAVVEDAALIAAEIITNAHEHGSPPVVVSVAITGKHVHLEVRDANPRRPIRPRASTTNMTGRGIALIDHLSTRWGVRREPTGKTVWADIGPTAGVPETHPDVDVDALIEAWDDAHGDDRELHTVVLGDVPTDLLLEAKAHVDNIVRELTLAEAADGSAGVEVPAGLAPLVESVVHGFAEARDAIKRAAIAAAERGEPRTRLVLRLPRSTAAAAVAYLDALDEADNYARAARLLTLEMPPEHRLFRRWYVGALIDGLRSADSRLPQVQARPFEDVLVGEVRRLTAAQRVTARLARLQRVAAALARTRTPEDVADVVVSEGVAALGASGGGLLVPDKDGTHLAVPGAVGYGEQLVGVLRDELLDAELPAATALRTGEAVWFESLAERDAQFPLLRGFEAETTSMCAVPLIVGDRRLGALRFSFASVKLFDEYERRFVLALAALTAHTLQRTELYEAERQAALGLQRALLPDRITPVPGWLPVARYTPAGGQEAGGDFYDVFPVGEHHLVALIGDVMGRGLEAAAAMGQIRSTIRAYALDDPQPDSVMRRTDAFFEALQLTQLVTVLYLLIDLRTDEVSVCSAGHLPPLLHEAGRASLVPIEVGLPFGVGRDERHATTLSVQPGSMLLLYTDGLVERPTEDIDAGIARLRQVLDDRPPEATEGYLDRLAAELQAPDHEDDVTVLLLARTP
jgi:serine phosphatase RsbU (regulator of sigma subunit)/anti-sigma regulatory factor (Ser/Thr protein kinase)